jgi:methylenetetrahydrofolate dehydrogenase (NADP+)/methenyltetrahydrofolate cyclohydrolase
MTAQIIDGKLIAQQVRDEVAASVSKRTAAGKMKPTLATVLVGDRPDSAAYVASKGKACQELGMGSISEHLPANATQEEVETLVKRLNADKTVNGILVQLPMPSHINEERVLSLINIEKDVDGFSPLNIGRLAQKGREPLFVPCTPYGCIYLLEKAGVKIEGANAVVLGRSNIVGMPSAKTPLSLSVIQAQRICPAQSGRQILLSRPSAKSKWCAAIGSSPARRSLTLASTLCQMQLRRVDSAL